MKRDVIERIEFSDFKKMYANRMLGGDDAAKKTLKNRPSAVACIG
jgi:hypothetical protein